MEQEQHKFINWSKIKKQVDDREVNITKDGEIWWCSIGENIGDEENGKNHLRERPVLILKKYNRRFCTIIPLTSKEYDNVFHHKITSIQNGTYAILTQVRSISSKRMNRLVARVTNEERLVILEKVSKLLL